MKRKRATDFPQGLLDLFDHYVHGEISRREFLDGTAKYAVGGLTAVAIWESLKPNYALADEVPRDDKRLKTEYATLPSPQGNGSIRGYLVGCGCILWSATACRGRCQPLLLHYASLDTRITAGWPGYEEALKANHVSYTAYVYEGVNHGFHNDTTPRYDDAAAKLAWQRTLDFFNKHLR